MHNPWRHTLVITQLISRQALSYRRTQVLSKLDRSRLIACATISTNGEFSAAYGPEYLRLSADTLVVTNDGGTVVHLTFVASSNGFKIDGMIDGKLVSGVTPFGPVTPDVWEGVYHKQNQNQDGTFDWTPTLQFDQDGKVYYNYTEERMALIPAFTYDYRMLVLEFGPEDKPFVFEMGYRLMPSVNQSSNLFER